jgi:hypothetical protein
VAAEIPGGDSGLALAADAGFIERTADPGAFIIAACEQAKTQLREALEDGEIDRVAEIRPRAEAVRALAAQKSLGNDARLAATELVRRAERCIGVAIRRGQEEGTIRGPHEGKLMRRPGSTEPLRSPREFGTLHELSGDGNRIKGIYDLTDGVSDEDFEAAVKEARAEGNLSRANVARKAQARAADAAGPGDDWIPVPGRHPGASAQRRSLIRKWAAQGYSSHQMGGLLSMRDDGVRRIAAAAGIAIAADKATANSRHLDSARIVRETVHSLEGLVMGIELADVASLNRAEAAEWAASLTTSVRALNRFARQLKETTHE